MKLSLIALALTLTSVAALAQTDAMPPETMAPGHTMPEKAPVPPSKQVLITFQGHVTQLTVEDLLKLPQVTLHVHNAHRNTDETYSGPLLSDVLAKAGLSPAHENEALILHSAIVATGTDKYFVIYSGAEVEPAFAKGQVIVAVMKSGLPDTEGGIIQIINSTDAKPARWLHGLADINVMSITPTK
jgi:hypothetical protein